MTRVTRYCFTLNNYTEENVEHIKLFARNRCSYLVAGREVGESGTPHLQGFLILKTSQRLSYLQRRLSNLAHYEQALGSNEQAANYCKKEGNFFEVGTFPNPRGQGSVIKNFKAWVQAQDRSPTPREVANEWPDIWVRYQNTIMEAITHWRPIPSMLGEGPHVLKDWQAELETKLQGDPDDRTILFYCDPEGAQGKSWFTRYYSDTYGDSQLLRVGRRDDLAHAIDTNTRVFFFDIPRGQLEFFQYTILEQLKDRVVFSPKYKSTSKVFDHDVHVVVFANEEYNNSMTYDRVQVTYLSDSDNNITT